MNGYDVYKVIEFIIFSLYLVFVYLSIQIWFLWRDVDKDELKEKTFVNESFFKKNCIYVLLFSIFFIIHEIVEGSSLPNSMIYFEFFEMLAFGCIVLFAYDWYAVLKTSANKKSLPLELTGSTKH